MIAITILSALTAVTVAYIALQQFLLAREKFKLDLFEKRFAVFKAVEKFINEAIANRTVSMEVLQQFDRETQTASFLFDNDIVTLIGEIRTKANTLTTLRGERFQLPPGSERVSASKREQDILEEFITTQQGLKNNFSAYLKFMTWKLGISLPMTV